MAGKFVTIPTLDRRESDWRSLRADGPDAAIKDTSA